MTDIAAISDLIDTFADPLGKGGLVASGRVSGVRFEAGRVSLILDVTGLTPDAREALEQKVRGALASIPDVTDIRLAMTSSKVGRMILAVASGKGGVGKSTLSANLAIALARAGLKVGLVDADIYGPSQPKLMQVEGTKPVAEGQKLIPVATPYGVPLLSMGQLVAPGQALAWRGPMAANALSQMVDADWSGQDILVVDMPPGTGDVQLSMVQKHKPAGAIIVSTPQDLSLIDAERAVSLFNTAGVPIIGLIENMAGYACPHCGEISDPFGKGGAEEAAKAMGLPFLGRVPLDISIRQSSDAGTPPAAGDGPGSAQFMEIAGQIANWIGHQRS